MKQMYNFLIEIIARVLPLTSFFSKKMKLFVQGRKQTMAILSEKIASTDAVIWVHTASLGEFEQGLPIIKSLKEKFPKHKIVVSFFSPSGYEIRKNTPIADAVVYLPLDVPSKVKSFLDAVHPQMAIFVKYEFWANYLSELKKRNIPTYLVSGIFRENQVFFKWYGGFMREVLSNFTHFFVQNSVSEKLLHSIGYQNVTLSGDTRFDRVVEILHRDNSLPFVEDFIQDKKCLVVGSSWQEDEAIYVDFINRTQLDFKTIIAPHNIDTEKIQLLRKQISKKVVLWSEKEGKTLSEYDVLIVDTIGILTKIYSYASVAYVGGAMKTGLHNVLEPATFSVPIVFGKRFDKFQEAVDLVAQKGAYSVCDKASLENIMTQLFTDEKFRKSAGNIAKNYVDTHLGATQMFVNFITSKAI